jgi:hypothetical protein
MVSNDRSGSDATFSVELCRISSRLYRGHARVREERRSVLRSGERRPGAAFCRIMSNSVAVVTPPNRRATGEYRVQADSGRMRRLLSNCVEFRRGGAGNAPESLRGEPGVRDLADSGRMGRFCRIVSNSVALAPGTATWATQRKLSRFVECCRKTGCLSQVS